MGTEYGVTCTQCGHRSRVPRGGGSAFHMLHCDECGAARTVPFEEIDELNARRYGGRSEEPAAHFGLVAQGDQASRLGEAEYRSAVEAHAGRHDCGGQFRFDAPPRCPKCRSAELRRDESDPFMTMYD